MPAGMAPRRSGRSAAGNSALPGRRSAHWNNGPCSRTGRPAGSQLIALDWVVGPGSVRPDLAVGLEVVVGRQVGLSVVDSNRAADNSYRSEPRRLKREPRARQVARAPPPP